MTGMDHFTCADVNALNLRLNGTLPYHLPQLPRTDPDKPTLKVETLYHALYVLLIIMLAKPHGFVNTLSTIFVMDPGRIHDILDFIQVFKHIDVVS